MLDLVKQIIKYYLQNKKIPSKDDLVINDNSLFEKKLSIFITIYKNWEIYWNAWNVLELNSNWINEIIINTIEALKDSRFENLRIEDLDKIKIRIDIIKNRDMLKNKKILEINPIKYWVLVIKKDYEKLAIILPNISTTITSGIDLENVLSKKLNENFDENNFIVYKIETDILTDF